MANEIVRKYSKALFDIGVQEQKLDLFLIQLRALRDALQRSTRGRMLFFNPTIEKDKKKALIDTFNFDPHLRAFLSILVQNRREKFLFQIIYEFGNQVNRFRNIQEGKIYVADKKVITDDLLNMIKQKLLALTGQKEIYLDVIEQPELIGGMRVFFGDKEIDFSYKTHLTRLKLLLRRI